MKRMTIGVYFTLAALALTGCGRVHNNVIVDHPPATMQRPSAVSIASIEVTSTEQNEDAQRLNADLKTTMESELKDMLASKNIAVSPHARDTIVATIRVVWGNRALRFFVGFGAGSGSVVVNVALKNPQGRTMYAIESKADLSTSRDMVGVAEDAVEEAVEELGDKLSASAPAHISQMSSEAGDSLSFNPQGGKSGGDMMRTSSHSSNHSWQEPRASHLVMRASTCSRTHMNRRVSSCSRFLQK